MGMQPINPTKIAKGKLISAFPGFVETWNWIVDFCVNLRGDSDGSSQGNGVFVDRAVNDHPVIRLNISEGGSESPLIISGTSGSSVQIGDGSASDAKTISFASASDANVSVTVTGSGQTSGGHYTNATVTIGVYYT